MKNLLTVLCIACMMMATTVSAASLKCEIVDIQESILPEGDNNTILIECDDLKDAKVGDKVKVRIQKPKGAIEGC